MSDRKSQKKLGISGLGFSTYEKRAIIVVIAFLLIGSGIRFYKHRVLSRKLEIWIAREVEKGRFDRNDSVYFGESEIVSQIRIDLNRAELEDLCKLPGIGVVKARAIINFRKTNGFFEKIGELEKVYGIGPAMIENLTNFIIIDTVHETLQDSLPKLNSRK